jgi:hypothetical protein
VGVPAMVPLHLRNALALPADLSTASLVDVLFSPVRSGCILTRADLTRCARDLDIKTRVADRRYTLGSLLERDRTRVCVWLSQEAARQADLVRATPVAFESITAHWERKALATSALLMQAATIPVATTPL